MADLYRPGDHYVICDRTGFKVRASQTRREWTGARVRSESWEARHPQDFVRARKDDMAADGYQVVPRVTGPLTTSVAVAGVAGSYNLVLTDVTRFDDGDTIMFPLASGDMHRAVIVSLVPATRTLTLSLPLPDTVPAGGEVVNYSAVAAPTYG